MKERRWPWLLSAALLFASGLAAGSATYLWWLPCAGQMMPGAAGFTDACLVRMDAGLPYPLAHAVEPFVPATYILASASMVLAAAAWLIAALAAAQWSGSSQLAGVAFGAALIWLAWVSLHPAPREGSDGPLEQLTLGAVDVTALAALAFLWSGWPGERRSGPRLLIVLAAVTAFSFLRIGMDYAVMSAWNSANWDAPPGTGYLSAAGLVVASVAVAVLTLRHRTPSTEPRLAAEATARV
ncbi:MAG: hypothetical protein QM708_02990 [Propioniciclava sp.]|uniref:hypothetical protein n=1 Tax=Propioniciclava sp. TaxID=2038686 RepID=UPI0039E6DE9B